VDNFSKMMEISNIFQMTSPENIGNEEKLAVRLEGSGGKKI